MKKQLIILLVCILIVAGLGTALWFLVGYVPTDTDSSVSTPASASVQLNQKTADELDTIAVQNEAGAFTLKNLGNGQYTLVGFEDAPLQATMLSSVANTGVSLMATSVVAEAPGNLADFGLASPRATLTAKYTDATQFVLLLGADAPGDNGIYAKTADADTVYLFSAYTFGNVMKAPMDFMDATVLVLPAVPPEAQQQGMVIMPETITLGGSFRADTIAIQKSTTASEEQKSFNLNLFEMTAPKARSVDSDNSSELFAGMLSLTAERVVAYKPDEAAMQTLGLSQPYSTLGLTWLDAENKEQSAQIRVSAKDAEGKVYLAKDGTPVVYQMAAANLPWYETRYSDMIATLQLLPYIDDVQTMTIETADKTTFTLKMEGSGDELKATCNGTPVDTAAFRTYYQNLIGIPSEEYTEDTPPAESTALLRITYTYHDSTRKTDTVALLPGPTRKVFLSINGEAEFYTKASYVDTILSNAQNLLEGKAIKPLY